MNYWHFTFDLSPLPQGDYLTAKDTDAYYLLERLNDAAKGELGKPLDFNGSFRQIKLAPFTAKDKLIKLHIVTENREYLEAVQRLMGFLQERGGYTNGVEGYTSGTEGKYQLDLYLLDVGERFQLARIERRTGVERRGNVDERISTNRFISENVFHEETDSDMEAADGRSHRDGRSQ